MWAKGRLVAEIGGVVGCVAGLHWLLGWPGVVQGASMLPTFPACCSVVWFTPIRGRALRYGSVVSATPPGNDSSNAGVVKRVAALEGDVIYNELTGETIEVPPKHVWLLGDNPAESRDSRAYGPVPVQNVNALVLYEIFPRPRRIPQTPPFLLVLDHV